MPKDFYRCTLENWNHKKMCSFIENGGENIRKNTGKREEQEVYAGNSIRRNLFIV